MPELMRTRRRYRITEAEAYSGMVLKNGKRRKMRDHDLKVCLQRTGRSSEQFHSYMTYTGPGQRGLPRDSPRHSRRRRAQDPQPRIHSEPHRHADVGRGLLSSHLRS